MKLRDLRNGVAQELGYPDYFALQVARYGLTTDEMLAFNRKFLAELKPLYLQLHTWVKYELAKKYGQPVPKAIPAHWINNRWSQNWTGFVERRGLRPLLQGLAARADREDRRGLLHGPGLRAAARQLLGQVRPLPREGRRPPQEEQPTPPAGTWTWTRTSARS